MAATLVDRTVSGFPLSISTGLAFESLFPPRQAVYDDSRKIPQKIALAEYNQMWINVDTLFRNMIQSSSKEIIHSTSYQEAAIVLDGEMETIRSILKNEGRGRTAPIFYLCDYQKALEKRHKAIDLRRDNSPTQTYIETMRRETMKILIEEVEGLHNFKGAIESIGVPTSALMLTHYPYDLLSRKLFTKLDLLESNTGKLKTPRQWNSKYYPLPGKDMSILPWYRFMLMTFGDKVLIVPQPKKLRDSIYETAVKRQWTPLTTMDKCMLDLSIDLNPYDYAVIRTF